MGLVIVLASHPISSILGDLVNPLDLEGILTTRRSDNEILGGIRGSSNGSNPAIVAFQGGSEGQLQAGRGSVHYSGWEMKVVGVPWQGGW